MSDLGSLMPDGALGALTGTDAGRVATPEAAATIGQPVQRPHGLQRVPMLLPLLIPVLTIMAAVAGAATFTPLLVRYAQHVEETYALGTGVYQLLILPVVIVMFAALAVVVSAARGRGLEATGRRYTAFYDKQLAGVHPYARGRVIAAAQDDGTVIVRTVLHTPTLDGPGRFDFQAAVIERVPFPGWATAAAHEHAAQRRLELVDLEQDCERLWRTAHAELAARAVDGRIVPLEESAVEARILANLINDGDAR